MPRIVTRPVIASIASITRLSWRSVVGSRHWLKHATTSIMSGSIMSDIGGCSSCRVGVGCPYSTQCSAALPHRHFGEGIVQKSVYFYVKDAVVRGNVADIAQQRSNRYNRLAMHSDGFAVLVTPVSVVFIKPSSPHGCLTLRQWHSGAWP